MADASNAVDPNVQSEHGNQVPATSPAPSSIEETQWADEAQREPQPPIKVFISYRRDDNEYNHILRIVRMAISELNENKDLKRDYPGTKIEQFIDVNSIDYGAKWKDQVVKALDESEMLLAFITSRYLESEQCRFELTTFRNKYGKKLCIPIFWNSRADIERVLGADSADGSSGQSQNSQVAEAEALVNSINGVEGILPRLVSTLKDAQDDYEFVEKCIADWLQSKMFTVVENIKNGIGEHDDTSAGEHEDLPSVSKSDAIASNPSKQEKQIKDLANIPLHMEARGGHATGCIDENGKFIIEAGSKVAPGYTNTCPRTVKNRRAEFSEFLDENGVLTSDLVFDSPSGAAGFISGSSINGKVTWMNADKRTINDLLED